MTHLLQINFTDPAESTTPLLFADLLDLAPTRFRAPFNKERSRCYSQSWNCLPGSGEEAKPCLLSIPVLMQAERESFSVSCCGVFTKSVLYRSSLSGSAKYSYCVCFFGAKIFEWFCSSLGVEILWVYFSSCVCRIERFCSCLLSSYRGYGRIKPKVSSYDMRRSQVSSIKLSISLM